MTTVDVDYVVVGAGCAGLSLAVHWAEAGLPQRLLLLDGRADLQHDRTWCFWQGRSHPFVDCITHSWPRWRLRHAGTEALCHAPTRPYQHLPSGRFYAKARACIEASPQLALRLGTAVQRIDVQADAVQVHSSAGTLRCHAVFDSRPRALPVGEHPWLQHFRGLHLQADAPCFDPGVATLMDFDVATRPGAVHFMYVLPFSRHRALVEDTYFSETPLPSTQHDAAIDAYLGQRFPQARFTRTGTEAGVLPMHVPTPRMVQPRLYAIGQAAGAIKPSTGYAFTFIQRHSAVLVARFGRQRLPAPPRMRSPWKLALDQVFLSHLRRHPDRAPATFLRLFQRNPPARTARFLGEESAWHQDLRVMASMPWSEFAHASVRSLPQLPGLWRPQMR
ncbi:MAG: lycopene cyclase family protein [Polyangiales bacterium]